MLLKEEIKARKHPGKCYVNAQPLPDDLIQSILRTLKGWCNKNVPLASNKNTFIVFTDTQLKNVMSDGQLLMNYITSRHSPVEQDVLMEKKHQQKIELEKKCM